VVGYYTAHFYYKLSLMEPHFNQNNNNSTNNNSTNTNNSNNQKPLRSTVLNKHRAERARNRVEEEEQKRSIKRIRDRCSAASKTDKNEKSVHH
jgi:hypothetical protein